MKRTSMNIEEGIFREIKKVAREQGVSQTNLIKLFLLEGLKQIKDAKANKKKTILIPTFGSTADRGGLHEGVDLRERSQLIDLLDERKRF